MSQGVENRGSLNSMPLAVRAMDGGREPGVFTQVRGPHVNRPFVLDDEVGAPLLNDPLVCQQIEDHPHPQ